MVNGEWVSEDRERKKEKQRKLRSHASAAMQGKTDADRHCNSLETLKIYAT